MTAVLYIFSLILVFSYESFAQTGNLVRNGNFERSLQVVNGISSVPNWKPSCNALITLKSTVSNFDQNSLFLQDTSDALSCRAYSEIFAIEPNQVFKLEAWAKWTQLVTNATNMPTVWVYFYDINGVEISGTTYGLFNGTISSRGFTQLKTTLRSPLNALTAKVMLYSNKASKLEIYFDGIYFGKDTSIPLQVEKYVSSTGTGDGSSETMAAKFNDSTFWSSVQTSLATSSVKVVFLPGDYTILSTSGRLTLSNMGHVNNRLVFFVRVHRPKKSI